MSYALQSDPGTATIVASEIAQQYNDCAKDYDEKYKATLGWDPAEYFVPILEMGLSKSASILDAGCGTGALVEGLRKAGFDGRIDGFDISSEMVEICKDRQVFQNAYVHDMYENFPVQDCEYDVVITTAALLFVDKKGMMNELARCVKPGGHLLIASRQDRMKSFGYVKELEAMVEEKSLVQLHADVKPLCGGREEYRQDEFLYMTFLFQKPKQNGNQKSGYLAGATPALATDGKATSNAANDAGVESDCSTADDKESKSSTTDETVCSPSAAVSP
jgi:ubiquinone/menaquinone biosynthesis C-methylase UbiE